MLGRVRRWAVTILIAIDLLGSATTGGAEYETISARLGRGAERRCGLCRLICARLLAPLLGIDHCDKAWREYRAIKAAIDQ